MLSSRLSQQSIHQVAFFNLGEHRLSLKPFLAAPMHDETFPLFAVSTLVPSCRSTPPIPNVYIPPRCVNPLHSRVRAALVVR